MGNSRTNGESYFVPSNWSLALGRRRDTWVIISADGTNNKAETDIACLLDKYGISLDGTTGIWLISGDVVWNSSLDEGDFYWRTESHDFHLHRFLDEDGKWLNEIIIDNEGYKNVVNGVNIVVYDKLTEKVVDVMGLDADCGYAIVR